MNQPDANDPLAYLVVDDFLQGHYEAFALGEALRRGLIDDLLAGPLAVDRTVEGGEELHFFLQVLATNRVVHQQDDKFVVTEAFRSALAFRELLEAKFRYAAMFARDLAADTSRVFGLGEVGESDAEYLRLFNFEEAKRGSESESEREQTATEDWVAYMSILSKHEVGVALSRYDFMQHSRMLDVGGNSGEFIMGICEATPSLRGVVLDLPAVVTIGRRIQADRPGSNQVEFIAGDAFNDQIPVGCDLISFKSTLHDWPDPEAETLIERAWAALEPGGTLLVFERTEVDLHEHAPMAFADLPILNWGWVYRGPGRYVKTLENLGCGDIVVDEFDLDLPWMLLTARKSST